MKTQFTLIVVLSLVMLIAPVLVYGFGINSPLIKEEHLLPGSHLERTVYLVRTNTQESWRGEIEFSSEIQKIQNWINLKPGTIIVIPKGIKQFPLKIIIDVPKDAQLGNYHGYIWVSKEATKKRGTQVSTAAGATIELDLQVTNQKYSNWQLRDWGIKNLDKGGKIIKAYLRIENLGNVKTKPSKVSLDIYDSYHQKLLSSGIDSDLEWIAPFATKEIIAEFPAKLESGHQFWGEIKIYKDGKVLLSDKRRFDVGKIPSLPISKTQRTQNVIDNKIGKGSIFNFLKSRIFWFVLTIIVLIIGAIFKR